MKPDDHSVMAWICESLKADSREPGWYTIAEIAEQAGEDEVRVKAFVRRQVATGLMVRKRVRAVTASGKHMSLWVYSRSEPKEATDGKATDAR